ncbi:MAG: hypothetical protein LBT29_05160 [Flavobacteriaceae bacterium]|nr:hypothetical protein [Flavobacteriaceae bacterium]
MLSVPFAACHDDDEPYPSCLNGNIIGGERVVIRKYKYQEKIVYTIDYIDRYYINGFVAPEVDIYDENCNIICHAGVSSNTCVDWDKAEYLGIVRNDE